ncbi:MAG: dienelactone hydrolase family protein [Gemmataceae bacterium]
MLRLLIAVFIIGLVTQAFAQKKESPLEKDTYTDKNGKTLPYRLLKPKKIEAKQKYPLVVFLHGAGERGNDNEKQLIHGVGNFVENLDKHPCFLVAPQCPSGQKWADWSAKGPQTPEPTEPCRLVLELIAKLQKDLPVDSKRIYITGLSMGGFGSWDLIARQPDLFAAAVPICGGGDAKTAEKIAKIPIWCFHGDKDTAVKVERSREMIEALKKAGGKPKYTEYPGVGHSSWVPAYKDPEMHDWLFSQKKE